MIWYGFHHKHWGLGSARPEEQRGRHGGATGEARWGRGLGFLGIRRAARKDGGLGGSGAKWTLGGEEGAAWFLCREGRWGWGKAAEGSGASYTSIRTLECSRVYGGVVRISGPRGPEPAPWAVVVDVWAWAGPTIGGRGFCHGRWNGRMVSKSPDFELRTYKLKYFGCLKLSYCYK
jgi:hypothetical protein